MTRVDLNADVGESFGHDAELMPAISSANIACGFHAGDPGVMRATVELARDHGVAVGAHPGFHDLAGFGRRELPVSPQQVEDLVAYQIGALAAIAAARGVRLRHVKAHGALYNMAARDRALADAIARATRSVDSALVLFGLSGSALLEAGAAAGLRTASEVFADRAYHANGSLAPRTHPDAVLHDPEIIAVRALAMSREQTVTTLEGTPLRLSVDTICVHGDTPGAVEIASRIRSSLVAAGIQVRAVGAS